MQNPGLVFLAKILIAIGVLYADEASMSIVSKATDERCYIVIDNAVVYDQDCEAQYEPSLIFYTRLQNYNGVWVFQDNPMGNACNGGDLRIFERQNAQEPIIYRGEIDWCGGGSPSFSVQQNTIRITDEARKPNRNFQGEPNFKSEEKTLKERVFVFQNGETRKLK